MSVCVHWHAIVVAICDPIKTLNMQMPFFAALE